MPLPLPLSVFLITKNEAERLRAALAAILSLGRDIVVVDSGSDDSTVAVAREMGARVIINAPFPGYGSQKRFAEDACSEKWVLNIDADEVVTTELADEIRALFALGEPDADGYLIDIVDVLPGDEVPGPLSYKLSPVRLYRKDRGRYADSLVHDRVAFPAGATLKRLRHCIHHHSIRSLFQQLEKLNAYSTLQAQDFVERGRKLPFGRIFTAFPIAFLKAYFARRLFLRGGYGFLLAMNLAIFRHLRIAKIYELQRRPRRELKGADIHDKDSKT
ncbi:MAG: putative glycosyltransferase [Nitrospira sp.]|nr:putative glycosyltransferase [Nitrospira sp.]